VAEGATALVVCGTTGEAPTLSPAEHRTLIDIAVGVSRGRIPVIAGAGSNATAHAIELTKDAEARGADAVLSVVPYYNKPTQAGLLAHFTAIANRRACRSSSTMFRVAPHAASPTKTVVRLAEMPQIIGLKDATGDTTRPGPAEAGGGQGLQLLSGRRCDRLGVLCSRRERLHFGDLQCRARSLPQHVPRLQAGQMVRAQRLSR